MNWTPFATGPDGEDLKVSFVARAPVMMSRFWRAKTSGVRYPVATLEALPAFVILGCDTPKSYEN